MQTPKSIDALSVATAELLRQEVVGMNLDNFIVRPTRRYVEKYAVA